MQSCGLPMEVRNPLGLALATAEHRWGQAPRRHYIEEDAAEPLPLLPELPWPELL
jgi:hypothetical protein